MGLFKIISFIVVPVAGMTYAAFSLGKQLPKATRLFGNYVGLTYVYFKCTLKTLKPEDQMPYDMIEMARKASQQSQALRRQLRNTFKKAKQDLNRKHEESMAQFNQKIKNNNDRHQDIEVNQEKAKQQKGINDQSGSQLMFEMIKSRNNLMETKKSKSNARKFFDEF